MKIRRAVGGVILFSYSVLTSAAWADGSLMDAVGKATGLISPPSDPPDFVKASRPSEEPAEIPAFATPQEPHSKVKSAAELKAMDADLEQASRRQGGGTAGKHDPSAKAEGHRKTKRGAKSQP